MLRSLVLAASVLAAVAAVAAEPGLEIETVTAIFQDRAGFLWVGSRAGLVRYDGYSSTLFEHDPADPASLSDNAIRTIFEDRHGFLWIGTNTAGLDRLDRTAGTFAHYRPCPSPNAQSLSIYAVVEDRDGTLWVGAQGGLCRFDPRTGAFTRFPAGPDGPGGDYVTALRLGRDGALWIATYGGGLSRRDPASGRFTTFRFDAGDPSSIASDSVFGIAEEGRGALWVATAQGPCRTSPRGGFERFPLGGKAPPVLTTGVAVDGDGDVWASTFGAGLHRLEAGASAFEPFPLRPGIPGGPTDRIAALLADRNGIVWAGTWGGGLARVSPGWRRIKTLVSPEPDADVTAILEDRRGRLWVGRGVRSLLLLEPGREPRSFAVPNAPLSLRDDPSGGLWIGSTAGLHHLDAARGTRGSVELVPGLAPGWVWATWIDRRGRLWAGTGGGGLHRRREDGTFDRFVHDPRDPHSLSEDYVTAIVEDAGGTLWVGTRARGLNAFDEAAGSFTRYLPDPADGRSLSHASVTALLAARDGSLWVGTGGTGINRVVREGAAGRTAFVRFSEAGGLIDDNVVSLAEDSDGTIWIGTRRGLGRFDPKSATFASYGADDGLPSAELHVGAASSGRSRIYFGTHRGAVVVEKGQPFPAVRPSPTVLVSIRTPSGHVEGSSAAWDTSGIEVPFGQWISLELATLDYGDRRRHRYAYRLEPLNQDWVDLGARRDLTFTALDPGKLTLRVRGRNEQGVWSEMGHPLSIRVIPRFWMTLWFRLLVASGIAGLAITVHLVRTARLERWNRELMRVKDQRERALEQAHASERSLGQAYTRLRELTGRLEAAKEEERKWIARELHDEMGTGLTTTKLILQLLAGAPSAEDREQRTGEAIGLLDRMIGHVRALSLDLRPPLLDELGLAAALRGYAETLARRAEVEIALETDGLPHRLAEGVRITAFRIVQEALTNVIRHSGARHVEVRVRYDPGWLDIRVADDGKGFDPAGELELRGHTGLLGMRERVESMQGEFEIRAAVGSGTAIHARLPATVEEGDDERAARR